MTMSEEKLQEMFLDDRNRSRKPTPRKEALEALVPDYVKRLSRLTSAMRHQNSYLPLKPLITPVPPYGSTFKYAIFLRHPNHLSQNRKTPCLSGFQKISTSRNVKTAEVWKCIKQQISRITRIVFKKRIRVIREIRCCFDIISVFDLLYFFPFFSRFLFFIAFSSIASSSACCFWRR